MIGQEKKIDYHKISKMKTCSCAKIIICGGESYSTNIDCAIIH